MTDFILNAHGHLLTDFNQPWLHPDRLQEYADAIHDARGALENCWGFVDGTVRPIYRPGEHQKLMYNGHKRVHAIKFQPVVAPDGLVANLYCAVGKLLCLLLYVRTVQLVFIYVHIYVPVSCFD